MRNRWSEFLTSLPSFVWLAVFVVIPGLMIFTIALRPTLPTGGIGEGWSLDAIRALADPNYIPVFLRTIGIAVVTTALCLLVALPTAYAMARTSPRWKTRLLLLIVVPFWTNFVIRVFAWQQILHSQGYLADFLRWLHLIEQNTRLLGNLGAITLVSTYTYLPFAILPLFAAAEKFDFSLLDAARDLGARPLRTFTTVFIPGVRSGIATAVLVVFIPMLGSYVIPDLVGGKDTQMIGNRIAQRSFNDRNLPQAAALSGALALLALLPLAFRRRSPQESPSR